MIEFKECKFGDNQSYNVPKVQFEASAWQIASGESLTCPKLGMSVVGAEAGVSLTYPGAQ